MVHISLSLSFEWDLVDSPELTLSLSLYLENLEQENALTSDYKIWIDQLVRKYAPQDKIEQFHNPEAFSPVSSRLNPLFFFFAPWIHESLKIFLYSESSNSDIATKPCRCFIASRLHSSSDPSTPCTGHLNLD